MINASDILGARVLIVDDQEANVRMLQSVLSEAQTIAFSCPRMTWRLSKQGSADRPSARFECLLSDAEFEGSTGSNGSTAGPCRRRLSGFSRPRT